MPSTEHVQKAGKKGRVKEGGVEGLLSQCKDNITHHGQKQLSYFTTLGFDTKLRVQLLLR